MSVAGRAKLVFDPWSQTVTATHISSVCETCSIDSEAYRGMEGDQIILTTR